jgi:uncharacterized membrane protein YqjE
MNEPIQYATPLPPRSTHDQIYTVLLGVVTFFCLIAVIEMGFLAHRPGQDPTSSWVFWMVCFIYMAFILFAGTVLLIRIVWPAYRKWATMAVNIVLLVVFPFGTALGIYGLWKVDKNI